MAAYFFPTSFSSKPLLCTRSAVKCTSIPETVHSVFLHTQTKNISRSICYKETEPQFFQSQRRHPFCQSVRIEMDSLGVLILFLTLHLSMQHLVLFAKRRVVLSSCWAALREWVRLLRIRHTTNNSMEANSLFLVSTLVRPYQILSQKPLQPSNSSKALYTSNRYTVDGRKEDVLKSFQILEWRLCGLIMQYLLRASLNYMSFANQNIICILNCETALHTKTIRSNADWKGNLIT